MNTAHFLSLLETQMIELSVVIALVWMLSVTVLRHRSHLVYALWMVVLVKAVTPPVWSCRTGVFSWAMRQSPPVSVVQTSADFSAPPMTLPLAPPVGVNPPPNPSSNPSESTITAASPAFHAMQPTPVILLAWLIGVALIIANILMMTSRLRRRLLRSAVAADHPAVGRLAEINLNAALAIAVTTEPIGPALLGVVQPLIVIPLDLVASISQRELRAIIAHETTHLRRGDHWVAACQRLVISIWWFNPLVWFAHHQINRTRELCCDRQTVANLNCDPADYAQMLLDVLRLRRSCPSVQTLFPGMHTMQITTRRMSALLNTRGEFQRRTPASAWILLVAAGLALIPGSGLVQTLAAEPPANATQLPPTPVNPKPATRPSGAPIIFHGVLSDLRQRWPLKGATVTISFQAGIPATNQATITQDLGPATVTTTAADGRFDLVIPGDLAAQNPNLDIFISMYHPRYGYRTLVSRWLRGFQREAEWVKKNAPDRTTLPGLDIQLTSADQLVGTLVGPDHRPLADARVAVMSVTLSPVNMLNDGVRTDAAGRFSIPAFGGGQTSLMIQPKDAAAFRLTSSASAEDGRIDMGTLVAPAGQPISGTVRSADGKPLVGLTVAARPVPDPSQLGWDTAPVRDGVTDALGRFTLLPVAVGTVQLTVVDPGVSGTHMFPDGMSVPGAYYQQASSSRFAPLRVNLSADRPVPTVDLQPSPQVRVVVKSVDPEGHPAEPLATFVTGKLNGIDGAWLTLKSGPDTVEALVPKGVSDARVGINDLSADDHRTVARVRRGDGPAVDAGMSDLGTLDHDVTDLTVVRFPRPKLTITVTDADGQPLPAALTAVRYAKPSSGNPYWDRLTRGSGSAQTFRSYEIFPGQQFTLSTTLEGYTTDTRDLMLDWQTDRTIEVRLTPVATAHPEKRD